MPKFFSFFLPQFHEIPENNEWWGDGFTEWTNVKRAVSLYDNHIQPIHPLNMNYYNLLNKETVIWQTQLMNDYGVDGLIYYHYYFKGKKLLEKPAENLLKWQDVNQPFFFCWANHDWKKNIDNKQIILIKQEYGIKDDWEDHFLYLIQFFKDERYLKIDNKPVFMVFDGCFEKCQKIIEYFGERCKDYGFDGLYFIETVQAKKQKERKNIIKLLNEKKSDYADKFFLREPDIVHVIYDSRIYYSFLYKVKKKLKKLFYDIKKRPFIYSFSGDVFCRYLFKEPFDSRFIHGLFFSWDNSPRHGYNGYVVTPPHKDTIFRVLDKLRNDDYVFVNAWNEWAEGMVLEPTEENGYEYLEIIREWKNKNI